MKRTSLCSFWAFLSVGIACFGFTACGGSDDDDNASGGGNGSAPANVVAVDLGLPSGLKWANMNIGANKPEDYGNYYAWGETTTKSVYSHSNIKYDWELTAANTKYNQNDGKTVLEAADDAAIANWGSPWRMPTLQDMQELVDNCTWEATSLNSVSGYKVTGKNGNTIFFPAAGHYNDETLSKSGTHCDYWTSTLENEGTSTYSKAWDLTMSISRGAPKIDDDKRDMGLPIRPVRK